jgi:hypothetical protein
LRNNALKGFGKGSANLVLLISGENVDNSIDRFRCAGSVECPENQVAGGRGGQRQFDRFEIAHFTYEEDVRIFAQGAAQGRPEGTSMHPDFSVLNETILAAMHELNRVLDGDDVIVPLQVRVIHHRRQGGGFAGPGRTGHKNEPFLEHREFL